MLCVASHGNLFYRAPVALSCHSSVFRMQHKRKIELCVPSVRLGFALKATVAAPLWPTLLYRFDIPFFLAGTAQKMIQNRNFRVANRFSLPKRTHRLTIASMRWLPLTGWMMGALFDKAPKRAPGNSWMLATWQMFRRQKRWQRKGPISL